MDIRKNSDLLINHRGHLGSTAILRMPGSYPTFPPGCFGDPEAQDRSNKRLEQGEIPALF
jgi:hypothetical protein